MEDLNNIPICDLFYKVAFVIARFFLETNQDNKYILVEIKHYSKWCETKVMQNHTIVTATKFLKEDVIYRYGVLKYILTTNGGEWLVEFDNLCKVYGI